MVQVLAFAAFAMLLARGLRAPRGTWRYIVGAAAAVLLGSQLLPEGNAFRADVAARSETLFWIGLALVPVASYAVVVRGLRKRTGVDAALAARGPKPQGLVQFAADAALAADTAAALEAEAAEAAGPAQVVSLGWRDPDGALVGHVRLRVAGAGAEIEMLRVEPDRRGAGVGTALLRAAEDVARERGAARIGALVGDWQASGFFARAGYVAGPAHETGRGPRRWMEAAL